MKTLRMIGLALIATLMCVNFAACSSGGDEPEIPQAPETPQKPTVPEDPKMCTVSINLESLVSVEEMPLGRAESNNDLYMICFYKTKDGQPTSYAYGLFDKSTDIAIRLIEGEEYTYQATGIKDGKDKVYKDTDGKYAYPFNSKLTNSFIYEEEYTLRPDLHYTSDGDGETQSVITAWDQYVTYNNTFTAEGNATLNMYLSRFNAFGTEFIADEMPDGELHITISSTYNETTYTSSDIIVTNEDTPVEQIFNIGQPLYSVSSFQYSGLPCTLNFIWKRENGDVVTLKPANINFQKNKKYIITVKVNPYTGISLTLDDNSFNQSQTESWEIVTGNAIKTE